MRVIEMKHGDYLCWSNFLKKNSNLTYDDDEKKLCEEKKKRSCHCETDTLISQDSCTINRNAFRLFLISLKSTKEKNLNTKVAN